MAETSDASPPERDPDAPEDPAKPGEADAGANAASDAASDAVADDPEIALDDEAIEEIGADELELTDDDAGDAKPAPAPPPRAAKRGKTRPPPPPPTSPPPIASRSRRRPSTMKPPATPPAPAATDGEPPRDEPADQATADGGAADEQSSGEPPPTPRARPRGLTQQFEALSRTRSATSGMPELAPPEPPPPDQPKVDPLVEPLDSPSVLELLITEQTQGSGEARAEALTRELDGTPSKERQGALAYELGEIYERQLGDEARAVKAFGRALQADPSLRANLWAIRRVFYRRGLWPNLVKLIGAETRFADNDAGRADLLVEKGHILEDQVQDAAEATASYDQAVAADPRCLPALYGLERMALRKGDEATIERVWQLLAAASDTPARKQSYLLDLVRLTGERGDLDRARDLMTQALEHGASDRLSRAREWLAERSGEPRDLLAALDARALELVARFGPAGPPDAGGEDGTDVDLSESPSDAATRLRRQVVAIRRRQARIAVNQVNEPERAWGYLQQAIALLPGEPLLVADLADLAERLGKYDELAELVEGWESQEVDPARSLSLSLRRVDALFRAGHEDSARALLATLSATQPGYVPVIALRERDALSSADYTALAETYVVAGEAARSGQGFGPGQPGRADALSAAGYYLVAGDLYRHLVRTPDVARVRYAQALEVQPGYPPAVDALGSLHDQAGRLDDAAALYELHSESGDPGFRAHVLERLVELYERLGRLDEVESALRRLVALAPDDTAIRWRLEEVLAALDRPRERCDVLVALAEKLDDTDLRAAATLEAARTLDDQLGETERAVDLYRKVIENWPNDRYTRQALAAALARAGRWEELAVERRAEATAASDDGTAVRALREAASVLLDRLDRPADAVAVCRELVERAPGDADALRTLSEALARAGNADAALETFEREVAARGEEPEAAEALARLAEHAERSGKLAEASAAWSRLLAVKPDAGRAAVAKLDLAVRTRDPAAEVEALIRLAESPVGKAMAADLLERAGWIAALAPAPVSDQAVSHFERAIDLDPGRRGALLGRLLVDARAGDPIALGDALGDLAAGLPGSYAAASLLLRSAVVAEVQGDDESKEARMSRALGAAPSDPGTLVAAAEYLPPPGPAAAYAAAEGGGEALARRAEVYAARAQIAVDPASQHDWQLGQAELLDALGRLGDASKVVGQVLTQRPADVRALQLMRRICRRGGDRESLARASASLARVIGDREGKLDLLREAVGVFHHEIGRLEAAVPLYRRILDEDAGAPEFERLHEILVAADDVAGLFEILSQRIHYLEIEDRGRALADLLVERAQLRARLGDDRGSARDLGVALEVDARHRDALFLRGQALKALGQPEGAAACLQAFLEDAEDDSRRPTAELALSEILAENMDDVAGAIVQLEHVARQAPTDVSVRERLIDLLVRAGDHGRAADEIRLVERLRTTPTERARDQLRLARLLRDHASDRAGAVTALERARELEPLASEPIRMLVELFPEGSERRSQILEQAAGELRASLLEDPGRAALYERLAVVSQWMDDVDARRFALEAQDAIGSIGAEPKRFLADARGRPLPDIALAKLSTALHPTEWAQLRDPAAGGFAAELWALIEGGVAAALPSDAGEIGFSRADRVKGKDLDRRFPLVLPLLRGFGCEEPEIYVSDKKPGYVRVTGGEKRALFLGADVADAKTAEARFGLARAVALLHEGTGPLGDLEDDDLAGWMAAAAQLAEAKVPAVVGARADAKRAGDRVRHLDKRLGRRERKAMSATAQRFAELGDAGEWRRAALRTGARAGLVLCGDLGVVLDMLDVGRGARSIVDDHGVLSLLAFAASAEHLALRRRLGVSK